MLLLNTIKDGLLNNTQQSFGQLILFSYNRVFVIKLIIRTGVISLVQKSVHFVLVKIYKTGITFVVFIKNIVYAGIATA